MVAGRKRGYFLRTLELFGLAWWGSSDGTTLPNRVVEGVYLPSTLVFEVVERRQHLELCHIIIAQELGVQ